MGNWADAPTQNRCWKEPASPSRRHAGLPRTMRVRRSGGTGRRAGLKIRCPQGRVSYAGEPMVPPRAPSFATRCAHAQASARQERGLAEPTKRQLCSYHGARAEVAELADAPDSKSGARKGVWVRFPPSAPDGRTESGSLRPARPSERQRGGQHAEAAVSEPDERITALPAVLAAPYSTVGAS